MDAILAIAQQHNVPVIEDACQAHGAEYKGRRAGSMGVAGCFSFYPGKNLGAYGDAGAVVSNNADLIDRIKMLRDHGSCQKYEHPMIGWNARMDGLQGAILSAKLRHLETANEARRAHARRYKELLVDCTEATLPVEADWARHVFHIFALCCDQRDSLMKHLAEKGVGCGIHYPKPLHLQAAYSFLGKGSGSFPVAEDCANKYVSLPMFPELTEEQIQYIADAVKSGLCGAK